MIVLGQDASGSSGRYRLAMRAPGSLFRRVRELHPTVADGLLAALVTLLGLPQLFS
jgi:hypothetical protein